MLSLNRTIVVLKCFTGKFTAEVFISLNRTIVVLKFHHIKKVKENSEGFESYYCSIEI